MFDRFTKANANITANLTRQATSRRSSVTDRSWVVGTPSTATDIITRFGGVAELRRGRTIYRDPSDASLAYRITVEPNGHYRCTLRRA